VCQDCGTKWFIPGHRVTEPDLTECGACGGALEMFAGHAGGDGQLPSPGEHEAQGGWT
jgi:hypothetical protein